MSWKLKWATFMIACHPSSVCPYFCLSVSPPVCKLSHLYLLLQYQTCNRYKAPFGKLWGFKVMKMKDRPFSKWAVGHNSKIHRRHLKIFLLQKCNQALHTTSLKYGKSSFYKWRVTSCNTEENTEIAKRHWPKSKIFSRTTHLVSTNLTTKPFDHKEFTFVKKESWSFQDKSEKAKIQCRYFEPLIS